MFGKPLPGFDWVTPDYGPIWDMRIHALAKLRADPILLSDTKAYYRENIPDFINDWGVTVDPRNVRTTRPVIMPFVLFPMQREFVDWFLKRWEGQENGVLVKSRDCGASWMAMAASVALCCFYESVSVGFGSATKDKVDSSGDPDTLFYKGGMFASYLPGEFTGHWSKDNKKHRADMFIGFPATESTITGDCGDRIGRGGRKTLYVVDEFAAVERPKLIEGNLIANTDCCIEMSTVKGIANVFAEHARGGLMPRFDFDYHDDPRKVDPDTRQLRPWFAAKKAKADPVIWATEYERDFLASVEGVIIPGEWIEACVGALEKLGLKPSGERRAAYDVADRGVDKNCVASAYGVELDYISSWSGSNSNIYKSVERVFRECDDRKVRAFDYDGDGMGAAVRGDAEKINEEREKKGLPLLIAVMFRGSGAVADPENLCPGTDRLNKDFFENYKAQSWWALRQRARMTWEWVVNGQPCDPSEILSINPALPELAKTKSELSQPVWTWSKAGKMMIDKTPDDVSSPNNGDTVMMLFPYSRPPMDVSDTILEMFGGSDHGVSLEDLNQQSYDR